MEKVNSGQFLSFKSVKLANKRTCFLPYTSFLISVTTSEIISRSSFRIFAGSLSLDLRHFSTTPVIHASNFSCANPITTFASTSVFSMILSFLTRRLKVRTTENHFLSRIPIIPHKWILVKRPCAGRTMQTHCSIEQYVCMGD